MWRSQYRADVPAKSPCTAQHSSAWRPWSSHLRRQSPTKLSPLSTSSAIFAGQSTLSGRPGASRGPTTTHDSEPVMPDRPIAEDIDAASRSKVPAITLSFWLIKILATTLGETGGDAVSMSLNLGYAVSSIIFIGIFVVAVGAQMAAKTFHPFL